MRVAIAYLATIVDCCFQAFVLVRQALNARARSHGYDAKAEPQTTGSAGTAAVQSTPDGIRKYMDEFNLHFQRYRQVNQPCS